MEYNKNVNLETLNFFLKKRRRKGINDDIKPNIAK